MEFNDPLSALRDIHLPEPPGFWPPAPGWFILILLTLAVALYVAYWWHHRYGKLRRLQKLALADLNTIQQHYAETHDAQQAAEQLNQLLKRLALSFYPRTDVASLQGSAWLDFLSSHAKAIHQEAAQILITAPYQKQVNTDVNPLFDAVTQWIKQLTPDLQKRNPHGQ